jgi:hypothetical protein
MAAVLAAKKKAPLTVNIEMGQAFRDALPALVRKIGGRVWSTRLNAPFYTLVIVRATFYGGKTAREVENAIWAEWPMCSVGVRSVGRVPEEE